MTWADLARFARFEKAGVGYVIRGGRVYQVSVEQYLATPVAELADAEFRTSEVEAALVAERQRAELRPQN